MLHSSVPYNITIEGEDQSSRKVRVRPLLILLLMYSTTALLSGRDRPLRRCVLRPRGSEPKTRCTGAWRTLPQASASPQRALESGARPLSVTNARPRIRTFRHPLRRAWPEVCRWITYLAGNSSSWELRADRPGPTVITLPWLQTARKTVLFSKLQTVGLSLSVRREIRMLDVRAYEGAYDMRDRLRHGIQLSLVPRA